MWHGAHHRYASAFVLANTTKPNHWAHPLQIPKGGSLGEVAPRAWHDPAEYEATEALEAAWAAIAAEVASLPIGNEGCVRPGTIVFCATRVFAVGWL
jgi:hypothetical protein